VSIVWENADGVGITLTIAATRIIAAAVVAHIFFVYI
jgi:hypothetical protein